MLTQEGNTQQFSLILIAQVEPIYQKGSSIDYNLKLPAS